MNTLGLNRPVYSFGLGVPGALFLPTFIKILNPGGADESDTNPFEREDQIMIAIIKEFMKRI
jgi:hypothetical protein